MGTARSDSPPKPRPLNSPQGGATLQNGGVAPPALGGRSVASCRSLRALELLCEKAQEALELFFCFLPKKIQVPFSNTRPQPPRDLEKTTQQSTTQH
jgi:hypothetical protein